MPIIGLKKVTDGAKLAEDVFTPLGGLLFQKGTLIFARELEFLEAFCIEEIQIEDSELTYTKPENVTEKVEPEGKTAASKGNADFEKKYNQTITSVKSLIMHVRGGQNVPVIEIREAISPMLQQVQEQPNLLLLLLKVSNADNYTYEHSVAVGLLSYMIAKWMKIPEKEWMQIALAGTLLDIGKTKVDQKLLHKPGKLTEEEFEEVKKHAVYGYQIIKMSPGLNEGVAYAALQHHEREDGSGYPLGVQGSKIHLYSKIVAVADVFHAMCSNRVYRKAVSPYQVVEQLIADSFGKLEPSIVHTFVNGITQFSVGTNVELSDGSYAKIVFTDRNYPTRPMVEVNGSIINLAENKKLSIVKVI